MKRSIWLLLLVVITLGMIIAWHQSPFSPPPQTQLVQQIRPPATLPTVDAQRLLTDLDALAFNRFSESDRAKARRYITESLEDSGWTVREMPFEGGINLYAERSGSGSGDILLGAHYDSVELSPGVDDNATSIAVLLEAARLLNTSTPRTLKLLFFDLEELGLLGSQAFANDQEKLQPDRFKGAVILDMVGYACHVAKCQTYPPVLPITPPTDRGDFLAVIGNQGHPELMSSFTQSRPALPQVLTLAIPTLGGFTPDLVRSDHAPFWKKGLGAVLVTDTANFRNPNYHQPTDTLETIDREFFLGSTQIIVNAVATLLQGSD
jgi:Peptidase family M28